MLDSYFGTERDPVETNVRLMGLCADFDRKDKDIGTFDGEESFRSGPV